MIEWSDSRGLMLYSALSSLTVAAYSVLRCWRGVTIRPEEQQVFVPMARTSPAVLQFDPRVSQDAPARPAAGGDSA